MGPVESADLIRQLAGAQQMQLKRSAKNPFAEEPTGFLFIGSRPSPG
jgi:hypothetical protein